MAFNSAEVLAALEEIHDVWQTFAVLLLSSLEDPTSSNGRKQINLVLLGKTGGGKSATGNSALGRREFRSSASASSVTSEVTCSQGVCGNYVINIVDTPGLADTHFGEDKVKEAEQIIENMEKAIKMSPGGVHAFLYVVQFGTRFTDEDKRALATLRRIFGRSFLERNGIILFTHGDCFESSMDMENTPYKSFDGWYKEQRGAMRDLIQECSNKCILFNNRLRDRGAMKKQVETLVGLVERCESSYTIFDFMMFQCLRDHLIVELKLPQLKQTFQHEIDQLNSVITRKVRLGSASPVEVFLVKFQIQQLLRKINMEDKGTNLLTDLLVELRKINLQLNNYIERQEEARRRREEDTSRCSIM